MCDDSLSDVPVRYVAVRGVLAIVTKLLPEFRMTARVSEELMKKETLVSDGLL